MLNKKALAASVSASPAIYSDDVFQTYLYTGNGSTQTITNGIDLAGEGGMVWMKGRSGATDHALYDTARGATYDFASNSAAAQTIQTTGLTAFNNNGFSIGSLAKLNTSTATYVSWTFREQPKFFDIVTYTGTGSARAISHNLGSVPGMIYIKNLDQSVGNPVYHQSLGNTKLLFMGSTSAAVTSSAYWNNTSPTSTEFTVGTDSGVNSSGINYVAYLFAHDAGGFGEAGTDNIISCGSYTGNGSSSGPTINLGYEPQWVMIKRADSTGSWWMMDVMRGTSQTDSLVLAANSSSEEASDGQSYARPLATGFSPGISYAGVNANGGTYIYMAIRRPMKPPTSGTEVFSPVARAGTQTLTSVTGFGFAPDALLSFDRGGIGIGASVWDRMRGPNRGLYSALTNAESTTATSSVMSFDQNGVTVSTDTGNFGVNRSGRNYIWWNFRRASKFFDVVCNTGGTSLTNQRITHNLTVAPELIILKARSAERNWQVYHSLLGINKWLWINASNAEQSVVDGYWGTAAPTSTDFGLNVDNVGISGQTFVAYLFASLDGISKVGSYTGNGSSQTINCGFSGGARFVLIKRTDAAGNWVTFDSARGIVSGNDPALYLNSTAAEVTTIDGIDPDSSGFVVNQESTLNLNVNGASYIYLSIS